MHQPTRFVIAALAITIGASTAPRVAQAGKAPAILTSLPDDTSIVASVDLKKVIAAPIAADALAMIKQKAATQLERAKAFGVDLEKDVSRITMALAGSGLSDSDNARLKVMIAEGKFKIDPKSLAAEEKTYEGVTYYATQDVDIAVISKKLYVVSDHHMTDVIDVIKGKAKNATKSAAAATLRTALGSTKMTDPGWMVGITSAADRQKMGAQGSDMAWFSASAALRTDAVDFAVRVGLGTAEQAKTMADAAGAQMSAAQQSMGSIGLGDLGKSLTIAAKGSVVAVAGTVTKAEISTISGLVSMMASQMGSASGSGAPPPGTKPTGGATKPAPSTSKPVTTTPTPAPAPKKTP